jgi:hypothetical protein
VCEGCGQAAASNWSHRIGRGVGGLWAPSNGLHLCGSGTTGCHGYIGAEPTLARDERGWRLESHEVPAEVPALHWLHGWVLLDDDGGFELVDAEAAGAALSRIFHVDKRR